MQASLRKNRQAVVVIHGIGEQRPMDTLRGFVEAVLDIKPATKNSPRALPPYYSKPDTFSEGFELRRLTTTGNFRPRTDFFEYYWAHKMPIAKWDRLIAWLRLLLCRSYADVPVQLLGLWRLVWALVGIAVVVCLLTVVFFFLPMLRPAWVPESATLPLGLVVILALIQWTVLAYVGDAAVYLSPDPRNIEARHAIRAAGVALLRRLHESNEFDRIIVVGHSLGSVIGYDILTHGWQSYCENHGFVETPCQKWLHTAEELAVSFQTVPDSEREQLRAKWMTASRQLWLEQRTNGCPWLVTDFITLGSPLAHGDLLLAANRAEFHRKTHQRELPLCPPILDHQGKLSYAANYEVRKGRANQKIPRTIFLPHHAACFTVTRWTNLYFPCQWLLKGDLIGGPISSLFGAGIKDCAVHTSAWKGFLSHTKYWDHDPTTKDWNNEALKALREAMDLQRGSFKDHT